MKLLAYLLMIGLLLTAQQPPPPADPLAAARAFREPERRYWKALELATTELANARQKYEKGSLDEFRSSLILVEQLARLADETLRGTGKDPAKNPKHFKRAEQKIRDIVRKVAGLEDTVSVEDRATVRKTRDSLQKLQEDLVMDIVGRRK